MQLQAVTAALKCLTKGSCNQAKTNIKSFLHKFQKNEATVEASCGGNAVLRSDEGIVTNEIGQEGMRGTVGAVVIDQGNLPIVTSYELTIDSFDI